MRLAGHRSFYKQFGIGKSNYLTSFQIIEQGNYDIVLVENCPCESKEELHKRERYFIEYLDCINNNIPTRTKYEYYQDNKDATVEYKKNWYQDNKDKEKEKQYRSDNKEKIKEYSQQYRQDNKDILNEKKRQRRLKMKSEGSP